MLTSEELEAIRGRAEAATDGGWSLIYEEGFITSDSDGDVVFALDMYRKEDATFIAHARTDVPALVDEVERQAVRIAELQQLMAQGHIKAHKYQGEATSRWAELYKCQCIIDGTPTKYPMMTAGPEPDDDVSSLLVERLKLDGDRITELESKLAIEVSELTIENSVRMQAEDEMLATAHHARGLEARIAELEAAQKPRPMAKAKGQRVLAEWFNPSGLSIRWDTTVWVGHTHTKIGHWDTEIDHDRPIGSAPHHWLPLPDQTEVKK